MLLALLFFPLSSSVLAATVSIESNTLHFHTDQMIYSSSEMSSVENLIEHITQHIPKSISTIIAEEMIANSITTSARKAKVETITRLLNIHVFDTSPALTVINYKPQTTAVVTSPVIRIEKEKATQSIIRQPKKIYLPTHSSSTKPHAIPSSVISPIQANTSVDPAVQTIENPLPIPEAIAKNAISEPEKIKDSQSDVPQKIEFKVNKFIVEGDSPVSEEDMIDYLEPLQGKLYDLKALQDVAQGLEQVIREEGFAFYRVVLPPQSISEGDVRFSIVAYTLENINIEGNENFSKEGIENSLPELQKGISPNTKNLANAIKVANKHPTKQLQLTFKQHETEEKLDANIKVTEQPRPYQFTLGYNNTGSKTSGEYRLMGGGQYSNLWGLDHIVNASYTLPPDHADTIQQYGGSYALPIYSLHGWLNMSYASSSTNSGTVANDLTITGAGEMIGLHYQQFLPKLEKYEHHLDVGLDSKHFLSDVQFKKVQLGSNVRSLPFSIAYRAEYPIDTIKTSYFIQWSMNTGWGSDNNDTLYNKSRSGSQSSWQLWRYGSNFSTSYEQWSLTTTLTGQYTQNALIAGEQLGIGGSYDVRGYEQRETGSDNGQIAKFELTTPSWQQINGFTFYDYGHGTLENPQAGQKKAWNLSSTGIGVKLAWHENLSSSLTFATALHDATTTKAFNNRLLLSVNLKY